MNVHITPHTLTGTVAAPPSKSYAHRYLIAAYLSGERCEVCHVGASRDITATLEGLQAMGLRYHANRDGVLLDGVSLPEVSSVDCRESGSTLRFLLPIAAALGINARFTGAEGLLSRPIAGLVDCLNAHGAGVEGLTVGGKLTAGDYVVDGTVSSQYITGLLFALPLLDGDSRILIEGDLVSRAYVDITLYVLAKAGVYVRETKGCFEVPGRQSYHLPKTVTVEGDWSSAAFMLAAGALGSPVTVTHLNRRTRQGDLAILPLLDRFGADVRIKNDSLTVRRRVLRSAVMDADKNPDLAQIFAVLAAFAEGESVIKHVDRLRFKETDRLATILDMLGRARVACRLSDGDLHVTGGRPRGAFFEGAMDHRTVMSACVLASFAEGESDVSTAEAVEKSYPDFFKDFIHLGGVVDGDI